MHMLRAACHCQITSFCPCDMAVPLDLPSKRFNSHIWQQQRLLMSRKAMEYWPRWSRTLS